MNIIERAATTLRHSRGLENSDWLWNFARPIYDRAIGLFGRNGLERNINGTDPILVIPRLRGLSEIYEPEVWREIMKEIRQTDFVADVGAFIGLYTIAIAKKLTGKGYVCAFEPDCKNHKLLIIQIKTASWEAAKIH